MVETLPQERWSRYVDRHPAGNVFHGPSIDRVFQEVPGYRPRLAAVLDRAGDVRALLTVVDINVLPRFARRLGTRAVSYGGVLSEPGRPGAEALDVLLRGYRDSRRGHAALFTELRHWSAVEREEIYLKAGFRAEPHFALRRRIPRSDDELLSGIGRRTRKQIRRGARRVTVRDWPEEAPVAEWYALIRRRYSALGVPAPPRQLFEAVRSLLVPARQARMLFAETPEGIGAVSLELVHKGTIYGWYEGVDRALSRYCPNETLIWEIMRWGLRHGCTTYDFGGGGRRGEPYGPRDFKLKFGARLIPVVRHRVIHAPVRMSLASAGYGLLRAFRGEAES
jgi:CelD/BcsL family acetyltransferase involved in cellulose biosynthesis